MNIIDKQWENGGRGVVVGAVAALALGLLAGCASPGPPQAPSLKLPQIPSEVTASRVGDEVRLHWTTLPRTTDKLLISGPIVAEICRETLGAAVKAKPIAASKTGTTSTPCAPVLLRLSVKPGESQAVDKLPAELTTDPARRLAYRVQLLNAAGRTAGASQPVFAAAGAAPPPVEELRSKATKAGVVLEWKALHAIPKTSGEPTFDATSVELDRTVLQPVAKANSALDSAKVLITNDAVGARVSAGHKSENPGANKPLVRLRGTEHGEVSGTAGSTGGTIDRTAQVGTTYRYAAERVRSVALGQVALGKETLEMRSLPSAEITVAMPKEFPPNAPKGLIAVPGFVEATVPSGEGAAIEGAAATAQRPTIDLSWEPDLEAGIAGYRVYRRGLTGEAAWQRISSDLGTPAYRDQSVVAGQRYAYRVTAINAAGDESVWSNEAVETAPTQ
ncbi:MAG: fibronectin type III domain-containing protein [Acidobacteriaceae bacterium]|nr:fibronectin type III domain-containing protein [Acidobacteriaceae bacterium]